MWTPPLVVLVICCGSILVFLTIIFVFVFVETRRATGKVSSPIIYFLLSTLSPVCSHDSVHERYLPVDVVMPNLLPMIICSSVTAHRA